MKTPSTAIVGASGYVGGRLARHLADRGRPVLALGRNSARLPAGDNIEPRTVDIGDRQATTEALRGVEVVYYLAHAMAAGDDFAARDRTLAQTFAEAADRAGIGRIVYLGGLGEGRLSEHLTSRHEVGAILAGSGVPTVELRAAIILGAGSISFEMLRYLTERLPVMICPRWVASRLQPIAESDLLEYLTQADTVEPGIYEIGGPDQISYLDMIRSYARIRGLRHRWIHTLSTLTPNLSSHWVDLVTPVDRRISHSLIRSMTADVVVHDQARTDAAFTVRPIGVEQAIRAALDRQAERIADRVTDFSNGLVDGVYALRSQVWLDPRSQAGAELDLELCGGDLNWYTVPWAWRARLLLGRLFGEGLSLHRPEVVEPGARIDWWTVRQCTPDTLVLETREWFCGEAWLSYRITDAPRRQLQQVGALRTRGLVGWAYWKALWPVHTVVFRMMARNQADRAHLLGCRDPLPPSSEDHPLKAGNSTKEQP